MKKKPDFFNDVFLNRMLKVLGVFILTIALIYLLSLFSPFWHRIGLALRNVLLPIFLAWLISLVIYPLVRGIEIRGVRPRAVSVSVVYVFVIGFIYAFGRLFGPLFGTQIRRFFNIDYPLIIDYFAGDFRDDFFLGERVYDFFARALQENAFLGSAADNVFVRLGELVPSTLYAVVVAIVILPIILLFYLLDYERVNRGLKALVPRKHMQLMGELIQHLNRTVGAYVRGQLLLIIIMGVVATMVFRLMGLNYYLLFGVLFGLANLIPYFGMLVAMLPIAVYAFITREASVHPLIIVAFALTLQFIEGSIFQPVIMGKRVQIHPLIIIISILFFGSLFGILGIIFASPIAATIHVLIRFYREREQLGSAETIVRD